ncbi:MAG: NifU family protein [Bacteriovoracaceae bacterium]|nr:NifU family protein [Bacteriovoracaceae bacterium]
MDLDFCSQKVRQRAMEPKFVGSESECDDYLKKKNHFMCHFHFPNSNGEITVYGQLITEGQSEVIGEAKFFTNVQGAPLAFLDALIELAHKRDYHSLPLLRLKEIEAYLRAKNSEPSFPNDGIQLLRYYELIHALKNSISKKMAYLPKDATENEKKSPTIEEYRPHSILLFNKEKMGEFVNLETALKVEIVSDVLAAHVRPLLQRDGGDVECIHVMENLVVLIFHGSCGTCGMSLTTTMDFIKKVLRTELFDTNIDIITDS